MKITRFINGKKVEKGFTEEIVIQNELISGTIEKINRRIHTNDDVRKNSINE